MYAIAVKWLEFGNWEAVLFLKKHQFFAHAQKNLSLIKAKSQNFFNPKSAHGRWLSKYWATTRIAAQFCMHVWTP